MHVNDAYIYARFKPGTPLYFYRLWPQYQKVRSWTASALGVKRSPAGKEVPPDILYIIDQDGKFENVGILDDDFEETGEFVLRAGAQDDDLIVAAEAIADVIRVVNFRPRK